MGPIQVLSRFNKLLEVKKGKEITTEFEEDEEGLQALIDQIEAQDEEEENAFQIPSLPPYISPWNGTTKVPKDLETTKSTLQTPFILDEIRFDSLPVGRVLNIKFYYLKVHLGAHTFDVHCYSLQYPHGQDLFLVCHSQLNTQPL